MMEVQKREMPIHSVIDLLTQYPVRFQGLGRFQGTQTVHLQHDAIPTIHPHRRVPIQL